MAYHPRIESKALTSFVTTRSRNSELWFANNRPLEEAILGYLAKFTARYKALVYAFAIEGNHIHAPIHFPGGNRASFMRDLNSCIARAVRRFVPEYSGGRFWGRRYSTEFLPGADDIEEYFFYTVLQPVQDGLVEQLHDYPGYNCFRDAIWGVEKNLKIVNWAGYNSAKRFNKNIRLDDFIQSVTFKYERLPGYENLSQGEYAKLMMRKLEERRRRIVADRRSKGLPFMGRERLLQRRPGALPVSTKTSVPFEHRPRVLSVNHDRRAFYRKWYFDVLNAYRVASLRYRQGDRKVKFPTGTFLPQIFEALTDSEKAGLKQRKKKPG